MGLFRKSSKVDPVELDALQERLDALQRRVESTETDHTLLGARVVKLDDIAADLNAGRADGTELETRLAALTDRLDQIAAVGSKLDQLTVQIDQIHQLSTEQHKETDERHTALRAELDQLRSATPADLGAQLDELARRVGATDTTAAETVARVAALDQRLTSVSTELANQLDELGHDIDAMVDLPSAPAAPERDGLTDEQLEAVKAGQAKLANEQARYEIAFRQDLAALAEQIRKSTSR